MDEHMAYFPIFIQLEEEDCLVAGGGRVAQRKVEILLEYGPKIRLVAPRVTDSLWKMGQQGKIQIFLRRFRPEDLEGARLVIAASNDPEVNGSISAACRQQNIPVNVFLSLPCPGKGSGCDSGNLHRRQQPGYGQIIEGEDSLGPSGRLRPGGQVGWRTAGALKSCCCQSFPQGKDF